MNLHRMLFVIVLTTFLNSTLLGQKTYITEKPTNIKNSFFKTIKHKFNFKNIHNPRLLLGGLVPKLPLAEVYISSDYELNKKCLLKSKGRAQACICLVAKINDAFVLIDTEEKFKEIFSPIDNEQEAISYVAYLTQTHPEYHITVSPGYRLFSTKFPSTYAKRIDGGFEVLLHDKKVFGCGPHPYFYKTFKVSDAGEFTLIDTVKMFEDPKEDDFCID